MKFLSIIGIIISIFIGCSGKVEKKDNKNMEKLEKKECKNKNQLTTEQKLKDFDYLYNYLKENYPFFGVNKRLHNVDWLGNRDRYIKMVKNTKNDKEYQETLNKILKDLNNGHTHVFNNGKAVKLFRDLYILFAKNYPNEWQRIMLPVFTHEKVSKRYNLDSVKDIKKIKSKFKKSKKSLNNLKIKDIVDGKVGYIHIKLMLNKEEREIKDKKIITEYLKKIKNYQTLIIDIRGNGGGSSRYWSDFLVPLLIDKELKYSSYMFYKDGDIYKKMSKFFKKQKQQVFKELKNLDLTTLPNLPQEIKDSFPYYMRGDSSVKPSKDSIKFKGNIYLVVDKKVYSSSEMFSVFTKNTNFATIVGETTGGDGIGSDPWVAMLPESGFIFRFSKSFGTDQKGVCNEEFKTTPDIIIKNPKINEDILKDKVILKILEVEKIKL